MKHSIAALVLIAGLVPSAALAVPAVSPTPPPSTDGDDIVVSGIGGSTTSAAPYGDSAVAGFAATGGVVGSITAFSVGTISCNIGNANAIWFGSTNQHPVIGTELYRYMPTDGGRIEMLGMNWVKHAFCAADQAGSNCGQLVSPPGTLHLETSCDYLGLFATDVYTASLNAQQNHLGRRSEINPWTGAYTYPGTDLSNTGNAIYKRVQVATSDLDPANAYFFEATYITTDETGSSRYNNYSYRSASWSTAGVNGTFTMTGQTQQGLPAIYAWRAIDPSVTMVNIDPSGTGDSATDGRFVLGYKVTDLGAGQWQYEYALLNMNNDRAAQSFSIPVASSVSVSNPGFHAPLWHSGEVYNNTPWTFSSSGGAAAWSMVNDNGDNSNALRWSVLHNYRFTADQPPTVANATITLFKPGTPTSVDVAVMVPSTPVPPPCTGDIDHDGHTTTLDLAALLSNFGSSVAPGTGADLNGDGAVNSADLGILLSGFGC